MGLFLAGLVVLLSGGFGALLLAGAPRVANLLGAASALVGCAIALIPVVATIVSGAGPAPFSQPWDVPYGSLSLAIDPLSAWFALAILGLASVPFEVIAVLIEGGRFGRWEGAVTSHRSLSVVLLAAALLVGGWTRTRADS